MNYKDRHNNFVFLAFKCRICRTCFSDPYELRMHSMFIHKGHMLL